MIVTRNFRKMIADRIELKSHNRFRSNRLLNAGGPGKSVRIRYPIPATGNLIMNLEVGQRAPDFTLIATGDRTIHLDAFKGKNVVLAFFPMAWTPI